MWFDLPATTPDWSRALRHLRKVDPTMRSLITRVGPCTLTPRADPFTALCNAIFSQQVSTAAASSMFGKFKALFPAGRPPPTRVLSIYKKDEEIIRACGLSRQKRSYLLDLSTRFDRREIPVPSFPSMTDEDIIQSLLPIKGVGRWTAEMFLIFVMSRPDLLPVDDLGLRRGIQIFYNLKDLPTKDQSIKIGTPWQPYRSIATWYLWRAQGQPEITKKKPLKDPS
jgi:DNA-3-methyladenine glycosylase II